MKDRYTFFLLVVGMLCCTQCSEKTGERLGKKGADSRNLSSKSPIVAQVDGTQIHVDDVENLLAKSDAGLSPKEALEALISQAVLANEARARGFSNKKIVDMTRKSAVAATVLETVVEGEANKAVADESVLREYYQSHKGDFVHKEKRVVTHFVALTEKGQSSHASERLAWKVYKQASTAISTAQFESLAKEIVPTEKDGGKVESLPPFEADSTQFVAPFVNAVFAIKGRYGVSKPVETTFGWHVVFLSDIVPPKNISFDAARPQIVAKMLPRLRIEKAALFMQRLRKNTNVFVYEDALAGKEGTP